MKNISSNREKLFEAIVLKLKAMNKRGVKALKKAEVQLEKQEKMFQKEYADFEKRYGKHI